MVVGVLGLFTILVLPKIAGEKKNDKWFGWLAGSWLCVILTFPLMANDIMTQRLNWYSLGQGGGVFSASSILQTLERLKTTIWFMLWEGPSTNINSINGDSFFSFGEDLVIALGLAYFFARPNWMRGFIFIAAFLGFLPHAIMSNPHVGRLYGCIVPFFFLGALALKEILDGLWRLPKGRTIYTLACVLLLGFWGWSARATFSRVYDQWSESDLSKHVLARREALKDQQLGNRIYFANTICNGVAYPLNEGNKIFLWSSPNLIDLAPGEKPKDVVLYLGPETTDDKGNLLKDQITKTFPKAQWEEIRNPQQTLKDGCTLLRCFIPYSDIAAVSSPFFEIRQATLPYWDREYSSGQFGLVFDMINYEDKVANINDPVPPSLLQNGMAVRYEGVIHVGADGKYELNWKAANRTEIWVDGKTRLNLYFPRTTRFMSPEKNGVDSLHLDAGDHQVEVMTCFQRSTAVPEISIRRSGSEGPGQSLWSSFNF
jgi:hypothetical protein